MNDQILRQYESAIEAAHAAGDVNAALEIARDLSAKFEAFGVKPEPRYKIGQAGMPAAIREEVRAASPGEQFVAGAGTVLPRAYQGVAQIFGGGDPSAKQNLDALAGATGWTMGGSLAGNAGLGAAIPAAVLTRGAGMVAGRVPPMMASRPAQVADTAITSAGVNAAIEPGDMGDRLTAGALGGGGAAIAPAMMGATQGARRVLTPTGRQIDVGENLARELNYDTEGLINSLRAPNQMDQLLGTRSSAYMATENPTLRVMETGSRAKRGDLWADFDRQMGDARWQALQGAAGTPDDLAQMRAARAAVTDPMRENALDKVSWQIMQQFGDVPQIRPLLERIDGLQTGAQRPNPAVQTMVNFVKGELGQGVTPSQIYTVRKMLTDGIVNAPTSDLSQAARAARPERMQIIAAIDDTLDDMSGGQWKAYMARYGAESEGITSKDAMQRIAETLRRGQPEGVTPPALGERPAPATVGRLRDQHGQKQFGSQVIDRLQPDDRGVVDALISSLKRQQEGMVAPSVLGSHTGALLANMGRADTATKNAVGAALSAKLPGGGMLSSRLFDAAGRKAEEELARLVQNPDELARALERAAMARALMRGAQRTGSATGMGLSGQQ